MASELDAGRVEDCQPVSLYTQRKFRNLTHAKNPVWFLKIKKQLNLILYILWYILFLIYKKGNFVANQRKYTVMSIYTQSNNGEKKNGQNKSFFILHGVMSNAPYIVICDLGTVLELRLLHSFTYLKKKNYTVYWYIHILGLVYRIALLHSD